MTNNKILHVNKLKKYYENEQGLVDKLLDRQPQPLRAVDGVSFSVNRNETLGIVGESGCGKSTLARSLIGLHTPTNGYIKYQDRLVSEWTKGYKKSFARQVQFVFQDPSSNLDPKQTIRQSIREPLEIHGIGDTDHINKLVSETIERVGIPADQLDRYPSELSGGQQQRVVIARAIILKPELLILDEPTSALDVSIQAQILNLLEELSMELDLTTIIISHNLSVISYLCDRIAVMYLGKLVEIGPSYNVFNQPEHPYTEALMESNQQVGDFISKSNTIDPDIPSPRDPPCGCRFHTRCPKIIPPEKFNITQNNWNSIIKYKSDLRSNKNLLDEIIKVAQNEDINLDNNNEFKSFLKKQYNISSNITDQKVDDLIDNSLDHLVRMNRKKALDCIKGNLESICENKEPIENEVGTNHTANCHLIEQNE